MLAGSPPEDDIGMNDTRTCELCGDPIEPGQAWMLAEGGAMAHSGCVYRDTDRADRDRWMPPDTR